VHPEDTQREVETAKAAQEEARNKAKSNKKLSSESAGKVGPAAEEEQKKEREPPRALGLFDHPVAPQPAPKPTRVAPVAATAILASADGDCICLHER
jgi:hypothetical protein